MDKDDNFFEFTVDDVNHEENKSISIPPITINTAYSPHIKRDFLTPFNMGYTKNNQNYYYTFLKKAYEYKNIKKDQVPFVPFKSYWPTYDAMTEKQKDWYFYWRNMIRQGLYIDTDLSYIFLYVYEIINDIGIENKQDGFNKLYGVWSEYRRKYPKLDNYLVDWIFDYILINNLDVDISKIIDILKDKVFLYCNTNILISFYVKRPINDLPLTLLKALIDYKIENSAFFKCGKDGIFIETLYKMLVCLEDKICKKSDFFFEKFNPQRFEIKQRFPFKSALYAGNTNVINITIIPYSNIIKLRKLLTCCIKFTENSLRKKFGIKGKLVLNADEKLLKLFDACYKAIDRKINKITIDDAKLNKLIDESNIIKDRLILNEETDDIENALPLYPNNTNKTENLSESKNKNNVLNLDEYEINALNVLINGKNVVDNLKRISENNNIMYEIMLDNINEKLMQHIGDIVIDTTQNIPVILKDYVETIKSLIN